MKIALCGQMRSGKNTVADYLTEKYGFEQFAFGTGIKQTIKNLFPEQWENGKPRKLMQDIGQGMRQHDPDVWVKYLQRELNQSHSERIVITDLRQPNEYQHLLEQGFEIVRISAPFERRMENIEKAGDKFNRQDLLHETEKHVAKFEVDFEIDNNGSLQELYMKVDGIISTLSGGELL